MDGYLAGENGIGRTESAPRRFIVHTRRPTDPVRGDCGFALALVTTLLVGAIFMKNSSCVILIPAFAQVEPHCEYSLRQLESQGYVVRRLFGQAAVDRARSRLATDALADGFEELMWIDADIAFEPRSVERLRGHGLPIACGLYPVKGEKRLSSVLLPGTREVVFGSEGGLLEIRYAAAGFLYTRRQVYLDIQQGERLPVCDRAVKPLVPYFLPMIHEESGVSWYLGEDYAFGERARRHGYRVFADTTIRLQHIGVYGYGWEDLGGGTARTESFRFRV